MKVNYSDLRNMKIRTQPYTTSNHIKPGQYHDFRKEPQKIRTHLEDFKPYEDYKSVLDFYSLIDWMNCDKSNYESCDSRLYEKVDNETNFFKQKYYRASLLGWFFRDLTLNLSPDSNYWSNLYQTYQINDDQFDLEMNPFQIDFLKNIHENFSNIERSELFDFLEVGGLPTIFEKAKGDNSSNYGYQFVFQIYTFGDSDEEIFYNFTYTVEAISKVLESMHKSFPSTNRK